jgi:hypothetical protein
MTDTIEYHSVVDKADWSRGPWDNEPDKKQWKDDATALPCLIVRGPSGALCGYVGVPTGHPWHGKDYDNCDADCHGGLTYAAGCSHHADPAQGICHIPGANEPDDVWWFGFDCAHSGDLTSMSSPEYIRERYQRRGDVYRDAAYVERECAKLARQAALVAAQGTSAGTAETGTGSGFSPHARSAVADAPTPPPRS